MTVSAIPAVNVFSIHKKSKPQPRVYFGDVEAAPGAEKVPSLRKPTDVEKQVRRAYDLLGWWLDKQFLPDTPLRDSEFTVLDIETMGFNRSQKDVRIIEVAALKYRDGVEVSRFSTLVKPEGVIPQDIQNLTHITQEMADRGMNQRQALESLARFVGPHPTLVAHNASFDIPFLRSKLHQSGLDEWISRFDLKRAICPLTLARTAMPQLFDYPKKGAGLYKAETLAKYFGLENPSAHRAEDDTRTTALTLYKLIEALQQGKEKTGNPMETLRDLFAYQGPAVSMSANPIPVPDLQPFDLVTKARDVLGGVKPEKTA